MREGGGLSKGITSVDHSYNTPTYDAIKFSLIVSSDKLALVCRHLSRQSDRQTDRQGGGTTKEIPTIRLE